MSTIPRPYWWTGNCRWSRSIRIAIVAVYSCELAGITRFAGIPLAGSGRLSFLLIWLVFGLVAVGVLAGFVIAIYLVINTFKNHNKK